MDTRRPRMSGSGQRASGLKLVAGVLGVAVAYLATGMLCLAAMPRGYPPAVWAPAGVGLVAVLLGGPRLAPAVVLGSFAVNLFAFHLAGSGRSVPGVVLASAVVGTGAALQALIGSLLVRRFVANPAAFDEAPDLGILVMLAGALASAVGATIATATLLAVRAIPAGELWMRWSTTWLGETTGSILVAPLLVAWRSRQRQLPGRRLWVTLPVVLAGTLVLVLFVRASHWEPWLVFTAGILFVAWLEAFRLIIAGRTSKVELMVAQRTRELEVSNRAVEEQRAELTRSNAELAAALKAKEILLRELHHRVKNNLQVIASLFSLQARYLPDARSKEIFEESRNRVFSIALAHEKLYRSKDLGRIDFSEYARNLIGHLHSMFGTGSGVDLVTEIHEMTLPVETAIPCGLVINELVSNAFKHAFPAGRRGAIRVVLRELDSARWMMAVEDDGVGLPAGIALGKADSLGLDLVSILAAQIGAEVELRREGGTSFRMTFAVRRRADA
jgi:two-component sensor histidine kinase/integral membrane sensor domain MASE1